MKNRANRRGRWDLRTGCWALACGATVLAGCASRGGVPDARESIARAMVFLEGERSPLGYPGEEEAVARAPDWPQYFGIGPGPLKCRSLDSNPFLAALVHHALFRVTPEHAGSLGLSPEDMARARRLRLRAVAVMERFCLEGSGGMVGYWQPWPDGQRRDRIGAAVRQFVLGGPRLGGELAPAGKPGFPRPFQLWPDADTTALVQVALDQHRRLEGGGGGDFRLAHFVEWRDDGRFPRIFPASDHLAPRSGAYLTWWAPASRAVPNDCDLVVNANVLFASGWYGVVEEVRADPAIEWISRAMGEDAACDPGSLTRYYGASNALYYAVSKAYREGGITALGQAAEAAADRIEATASVEGGVARWGGRDGVLDTAYALLTLLNVGRETPLVAAAARGLCEGQREEGGGWRARWHPFATTDSGVRLFFRADAFTTALATEALVRYALAYPP